MSGPAGQYFVRVYDHTACEHSAVLYYNSSFVSTVLDPVEFCQTTIYKDQLTFVGFIDHQTAFNISYPMSKYLGPAWSYLGQ